jgi:uncharacterized cupredoxin-like copper-binding protein
MFDTKHTFTGASGSAQLVNHRNTKQKETKMRGIMTCAAGMVSLVLVLAFSNAFGQGENPGSADTNAGYGSTISSQEPGNKKTAAAVPDTAEGSVEVKLLEYKIEMPDSVGAGATTFKVTNTGEKTHGFEIEGNGIEKALKPRLKKGGSGSLQVDLKPGTYKVYCPVFGHKMRGMSLDLTVK